MTLIGILMALVAERLAGQVPWLGQPHLIERLVREPQRLIPMPAYWRSAAAPVILVLLVAGATAAVGWALAHPVLNLIFDASVLFLCLGPRHLAQDVEQLIAAHERGDAEAERKLTRQLLLASERRASRRALLGALFIQSHENLFGVLLWFVAIGPAGAVLYRIASRMPRFLHDSQPGTEAERSAMVLHAALAWVPARLCAVLFGLAGSLDQSLAQWRRQLSQHDRNWRERSWALLSDVSAASLTVEDESGEVLPARLEDCLREVLAMQQRALLILLAAYGLFTAGGVI